MTNFGVTYKGNFSSTVNTNRGASPNIWGDCPWLSIFDGSVDGIQLYDDFAFGGLITSPTTQAALVGIPYSGFGSAGSTITHDDAAGGAVVLSETTVDEAVSIESEQHPFVISNVSGSLWFEARIKLLLTATTENSWFVGLKDTTANTAAIPLTATGALADVNLIGFHKPEANTTAYDTSYRSDGLASPVEVNSDIGAIVDATYFKVGMKFGNHDKKLRFYVNGLEQAATKTIVDALGTTFPSDIRLGLCAAMGVGAAASDNTLSVDWWRAAQLL